MNCNHCGREAQADGTATHYLGCPAVRVEETEDFEKCEHPGCEEPKRPWSGKGAKPKFCAAGHKKGK